MDWLQEFELNFLRFIQTFRSEWINQLFIYITMFGEELIVILVLTFVYWVYSKSSGTRLTYAIGLSLLVNAGLKDVFQWVRPIGEEGIEALYTETATGFSFPSGHSQLAASWLTGVGMLVKKKWFTIGAGVMVALIGFSRLYLGVHYPKDVIVGIILGVFVVLYGTKLFEKAKRKSVLFLMTIGVFLPVFLFNPSKDFYVTLGLVLGFVAGYYVERSFVQFESPTSWKTATIRYVFGIILVILVKEGLKYVFLHLFGSDILILDLIRYVAIAFTIYGGVPYLFKQLKI